MSDWIDHDIVQGPLTREELGYCRAIAKNIERAAKAHKNSDARQKTLTDIKREKHRLRLASAALLRLMLAQADLPTHIKAARLEIKNAAKGLRRANSRTTRSHYDAEEIRRQHSEVTKQALAEAKARHILQAKRELAARKQRNEAAKVQREEARRQRLIIEAEEAKLPPGLRSSYKPEGPHCTFRYERGPLQIERLPDGGLRPYSILRIMPDPEALRLNSL